MLPDISGALARARANAPFLSLLLDREPVLAARLAAGQCDPAFTSATPDMPTARRLRLDRRALALTVAIGDLSGAMDLTAVTQALSDFADRALDQAIRAAIEERTPGAEPRGFAAIALGKQGSRELPDRFAHHGTPPSGFLSGAACAARIQPAHGTRSALGL